MTPTKPRFPDRLGTTVVMLAAAARFACRIPLANADVGSDGSADSETDSIESVFRHRIQPLLDEFCFRCHNEDKMKSGVRLDLLNGAHEDRQLFLLRDMLGQLLDEAMPPEDEAQPTAGQRRVLVDWIGRSLRAAECRPREKNGSVRRLTVAQYRNTLRDLLGIEEDLTDVLPPDGVSAEGFRNNGRTMLLTPLMVEAYFSIAAKALDMCTVDEGARPAIQNFRVELGASINPEPRPDKLMLNGGRLLANQDFVATQLVARKPFDFDPFFMQTKFEFIEGYQGNNTVRSVEFEGPFYETWPPRTHTNLFFDSRRSDEPAAYAREIIEAFAARSFRRPITEEESAGLLAVWEDSFSETRDFRERVKNALLVVLTSPQFLFLIVANEVVAAYYGLGPRTERGFEFIPVKHESPHLGGVLTQAAILAGLSDGRESNPVKRGAWLARKIVAEPPDDPPRNVPALPEDGEGDVRLTLREKLERHRSQEGCAECHSRIDPWGLPLEQFDAGGLFKSDPAVDASSTLPDQTEVADAAGLRAHLAGGRIDQVAFSFLTHLASYATGRSLDYNEVELMRTGPRMIRTSARTCG